jgi:2-hydroxychromene-2-carboxylate isomerase
LAFGKSVLIYRGRKFDPKIPTDYPRTMKCETPSSRQQRWKAHLNVNLNYEPKHFPTNDMPASLITIAVQQAEHDVTELSLAIIRKCWVKEMDVAEDTPLIHTANQCGLDGIDPLCRE